MSLRLGWYTQLFMVTIASSAQAAGKLDAGWEKPEPQSEVTLIPESLLLLSRRQPVRSAAHSLDVPDEAESHAEGSQEGKDTPIGILSNPFRR